MYDLQFEDLEHVYRVDGIVRPSITQILRAVRVHRDDGTIASWFDYSMLSETKSYEVKSRGTWVADCVAARLLRLDQGPFPPAVLAALEAEAPEWFPFYTPFENWLTDELARGFSPLIVERPLYSMRYGYAGRPDLICLRLGNRPSVVEVKTGHALVETAVQTAAQEVLLQDQPDYEYRLQPHDRFALQLTPGERAKLIPHRNTTQDRAHWMACLTIFQAHQQHGASYGK